MIRHTVDAMLLSLRRRYLERQTDALFNLAVSVELDAVVIEQEQIKEGRRYDHHD